MNKAGVKKNSFKQKKSAESSGLKVASGESSDSSNLESIESFQNNVLMDKPNPRGPQIIIGSIEEDSGSS